MTLKQMLDKSQSPLRVWLDARLPNVSVPRAQWKAQLDRAELTGPPAGPDGARPDYSWLGHGIGQRVQWMFTPAVSDAVMQGALSCVGHGVLPEAAVNEFDAVVGNPSFTTEWSPDELSRWALLAGTFEQAYRAGSRVTDTLARWSTLDEALGSIDQRWVEDVTVVATRCARPVEQVRGRGTLLAGPSFSGSALVGGADGDLIAGDLLLDVKASIKPNLRGRDLQQLVTYTLLDFDNQYGLEHIAILMARQGVLIQWNLVELLSDMTSSPVELASLRAELHDLLAAAI